MPIKVPDNLPAQATLEDEGVLLITERVAMRQDVRPLEIALLNLMPEKIKTEMQISRLLGATPLQIELTLMTTSSYAPKNTSAEHMLAFYQPWKDVRDRKFDGLIITGAPIETLPFQDVVYWRELTQIFDWSLSHVQETYNICWGGQAALHHFHGVPKHELAQKMFGVFSHHVRGGRDGLLRGFNDIIPVPVSRHTEVRREDLPEGLTVLLESDESGLCLVRGRCQAADLYVQSSGIRHRHLGGRIQPRRGRRRGDRSAGPLFPRRRPGPRPGQQLAGAWQPADRQLDQRPLPVDLVRTGKHPRTAPGAVKELVNNPIWTLGLVGNGVDWMRTNNSVVGLRPRVVFGFLTALCILLRYAIHNAVLKYGDSKYPP